MRSEHIVTWQEVESVARHAFSVWGGQPELHWAEEAWRILVDRRLATYKGEVERSHVVVRFLALCAIYLDFCDAAWDEQHEPDYAEWAEGLGLTDFHLGLLIGRDPEMDKEDFEDEWESKVAMLTYFSNKVRPEVFQSLSDGLGGVNGLFRSLWLSNQEDAEDEIERQEMEQAVFSEDNGNKMRAYSWVDMGCPPFR